jgi:DNA-binding SARP family transcriptional activator
LAYPEGRVQSRRAQNSTLHTSDDPWQILICLFGAFRILRYGHRVPLRGGGRTEALLSFLALRVGQPVARETLLEAVWPGCDTGLASQALSSLVHSLHKMLGVSTRKADIVIHDGGCYQLNVGSEVAVDLSCFDVLVDQGEGYTRQGNTVTAIAAYEEAIRLYCGDLCVGNDLRAVIERERLRARYLTLLSRLAGHHLQECNYRDALTLAQRLLGADPCREDANRVVMRCHVRLGERSQALRQYRLCEEVLRREFEAPPEPATVELFDQIRLSPALI